MSFSKEELIKILAKDPNIKTAEDIQNVLKDLFGGMLQQMLEAELDNHLGYEKHDYQALCCSIEAETSRIKEKDRIFGDRRCSASRNFKACH